MTIERQTFERHAFISYAHIDNEPLTPEQNGWVTRFHSTLATMLSQRIGQKANIWRDDKLAGNDVFSDEIVEQFTHTALLIPVLTPRYLKSEWCTREIREFVAAAEKSGGLRVDNKCRVFKVIKTPVDSEAGLPAIIGQVLGYEFYDLDEDQTPRDLDPLFGDESRQAFLRKLNKLAWDIAQLWERMNVPTGPAVGGALPQASSGDAMSSTDAGAGEIAPAGADRPPVFLAEVSRDRRAAREMIEAALKMHGYRVLPDRPLPLDEESLVAAVNACLAECALSIHLIGSGYGMVPDGPGNRSIVVLQNDLATAHSRKRGLDRLIWLAAGTTGEQSLQQSFISALQTDSALQIGADLLTGNIESVKAAVHAALARIELALARRHALPQFSGARMVYLLCEERDRREIVPLIRHLRSCGVEVSTPVFTGDAAAVREANQQRLASCDAVIMYYGAGDEAWKFHQQNEVRKISGVRASNRPPPLYVYLADPPCADKELLQSLQEPGLIDGLAGFAPALLAPLIDSLPTADPAP